ncbi:MAG: N-acetyl-gamma-glutamyl-phosphate reductase [Dysgonamonadaceae bacterium]|nr:N-acetyl-gamma-glutamyl-phosphate reductase [Dysgonamonadaceae bacterium]
MIKTGIIGGAGYTAGELLRLLVNHPEVEIAFVHSSSNAGKPITEVHSGLAGETDLIFTDKTPDFSGLDALFLCSAHGDSRKFIDANPSLKTGTPKIIDLSTDFRHRATADGFVYGLPELNKPLIQKAERIANPGCFATAIQLALLPLAAAGKICGEMHVHAVTGSTGAGVKPAATTHFSWRDNNLSVYKAFEHQHLKEITESLQQLQPSICEPINFIPLRGGFPRGIFASVYTGCNLTEDEANALYKDFYRDAAFTFVTDASPDLKQAVNTNKCLLHVEKHGSKLLIISVLDNLLKGASGQAVQNMNLMFGLDERAGLRLKASAF